MTPSLLGSNFAGMDRQTDRQTAAPGSRFPSPQALPWLREGFLSRLHLLEAPQMFPCRHSMGPAVVPALSIPLLGFCRGSSWSEGWLAASQLADWAAAPDVCCWVLGMHMAGLGLETSAWPLAGWGELVLHLFDSIFAIL